MSVCYCGGYGKWGDCCKPVATRASRTRPPRRSIIGCGERANVAVTWENRLTAYCFDCALARCDAFPGQHPSANSR